MKWLLSILMFCLSLGYVYSETLTYHGSTIGTISETEICFDLASDAKLEELSFLFQSYYERYLNPKGKEALFTPAERRMLLLCTYVEMCNLSGLWTGLLCVYDGDEATKYNCGSPFDELIGYWIDREKMSSIRSRFHMKQYTEMENYAHYVLAMRKVLITDYQFQDKETGKQLPTDVDLEILKRLCESVARDRVEDFRYLERNFNAEAVLWDDYFYILKSEGFKQQWAHLRRYYQSRNTYLINLENTFNTQRQFSSDDLEVNALVNKLDEAWCQEIRKLRALLHRCVYDVPYCLLVAKATHFISRRLTSSESNSILGSIGRWALRDDNEIRRARAYFLMCQGQFTDTEDVMRNLTARQSIILTGRLIEVLKMAMGKDAYNGLREQSKLMKEMEKISR